MQNFQTYCSKDYYLSSVLVAAGCQLSHLAKNDNGVFDFVFNESPEKCNEIINSYWSSNLKVDARTLIGAINELKTRIHSSA